MTRLAMPVLPTPLEPVGDLVLELQGVQLWVKRDDLTFSHIMGNKWRKLKYNLREAKKLGHDTLVTFGGSYSNHIYATAAAGRLFGFKTFGLIRGEEHIPLNPVLAFATSCGMRLIYIDRDKYREKNLETMVDFMRRHCGGGYLLPEGGSNDLAVKGCEEIVSEIDVDFDLICCASGTGATLAGIICALQPHQKALGFPVLKEGSFLADDIKKFIGQDNTRADAWSLNLDYHFGGYAKSSPELERFMQHFTERTKIPLDYVYTGKMMYGIYDLIERRAIKRGTRVIAVHTGGYIPNL